MDTCDLLLTGISQLVTAPVGGMRRGAAMSELEVIPDAAIALIGDSIGWAGPRGEWHGTAARALDLGGRAVIPALVDPHTHLIWAGDRLADFEARVAEVAYEEILARGGGIRSSIRATAAATHEELVALAVPRVRALMASGAGTIEIKSGYGFTREAELASLEALAALRDHVGADLHATLLIHLPPADPAERVDYLQMVTEHLIPEAASRGLASAVDVFIEREAWQPEEASAIFRAARAHGLDIKAHVDQFHAIGGVEVAIAHGALSVDHLEASGPAQVAVLAGSETVGTILPGVTLHLGIPAAPGRALIEAGAAVAIGTDCNPGSSPLFSTQQALALAVRLNGLTPAEALIASTVNAAAALGLEDRGAIAAGLRADLVVLDDPDWRTVAWTLGRSPVERLFLAGKEFRA
jgi:imidazolonepropionase